MYNKKTLKSEILVALVTTFFLIFIPPLHAETLKIGAIAPLSGAGAPWGKALTQGVQLAVDDINNAGGLKINNITYNLKFIEYDDEYKGAVGVQVATRLISTDKVKIIFGSISSASVLAFTPITEKNKILVLGNSYSSKAVSPDKQYFFRMLQTSTEGAKILIPYVLKQHPEIKRVALLGPNDESGRDLSATDIIEYKKAGVEVVYNEFYDRSQQDFNPQLSKLLQSKPDLIDVSASSPGTTGLIAKQSRELGYKGIFITTAGFFLKPTVEVAGKAVNGFYHAGQADLESDSNKMKEFNKKFTDKYGKQCDMWSAPLWYSSAIMLFNLMEKENTTDPTNLKNALEKIGYWEGMMGKMRFGGKEDYGIDHQILGPLLIYKVENETEKIVDIIDIAQR